MIQRDTAELSKYLSTNPARLWQHQWAVMYSISIHMVPKVPNWVTYSGQHFVSIVKILQQHGNLWLIRGSGKKLPKSPLDALHDASSQYLRKERDSGCVRLCISIGPLRPSALTGARLPNTRTSVRGSTHIIIRPPPDNIVVFLYTNTHNAYY